MLKILLNLFSEKNNFHVKGASILGFKFFIHIGTVNLVGVKVIWGH